MNYKELILNGKSVREFKEKNIPVKWAILDDMWAEVHNFYDKKYKSIYFII